MKPSRSTGIRIDIDGDQIHISGPMKILRKVLPLQLLNYVEADGEVATTMADPIPERRRVGANAVVRRMRELAGKPGFAEWLNRKEASNA